MKKLSYHLNNLNKLFWSKVVESTRVDEKSLSIFRIISGLFLLCFSFPYFVWIEDVPQAFYEPPVLTLTSLYDGFPKSPFFLIVNVLLLILAICITVGVRARLSSILYLFFLYIAASFHFSFGKIDHGFIFYFMLLLCMCFSNWGSYLAVIPDKKLDPKFSDRALSLLAIFLCFGFFTAGFEKAIRWINFDLSSNGTGAWFYKEIELRNYLLAPYVPKYLPFVAFKLMDYVAVIFELLPVFLLLHSKKAWRVWLMFACLFHLCNAVMLNINFATVTIVYLAFADYSNFYEKLKAFFKNRSSWMLSSFLLLLICIARLNYLINKVPATNILLPNERTEANLYFGLLLYASVLYVLWMNTFRKQHV